MRCKHVFRTICEENTNRYGYTKRWCTKCGTLCTVIYDGKDGSIHRKYCKPKNGTCSTAHNTRSAKLPLFEDLWSDYCEEYKVAETPMDICIDFFDVVQRQLRTVR
jgi:hypothetical protein